MLGSYLKKHSFGLMMSIMMSAVMLSINIFKLEGFTSEAFRTIGIYYIPILAIAFIISTYIVSPIVQPIAKRLLNKDTKSSVRTMTMSLLMVTGMSLSMSLVVTIFQEDPEDNIPFIWLVRWVENFPIALSTHLLAVGPFVRCVHSTLFTRQNPDITKAVKVPSGN